MSASNPTILVTGASGKLGALYIEELLKIQTKFPFKLIAASRSIDKLAPLKEKGVELRKLDAFDASTIDTAFKGVDRIILISLDTPGKRFEGHKNLIDGAIKSGVKHILYTSCPVPVPDRPLYDEHFFTEAYLTVSTTIGHTLLRNTLYAETLLMSIPGAIAQGGNWTLATGNVARSYLTRGDLALAGAIAATTKFTKDSDRHVYEFTASESLNGEQVAKILNDALGTQIKPNYVPHETLVQIFSTFLPPIFVGALAALDSHTRDGYDLVINNQFQDLVGRAPITVAAWAAENKALLLSPPQH